MKQSTCLEPKIGRLGMALSLPDHATELRTNGVPTETSVDELIVKALDNPIDFPPLPRALIDDDHVAIAIEEGVPNANQIACSLVRYLQHHGTDTSRITIVLGANNDGWRNQLKSEFVALGLADVKVVKHEPTNQVAHGYVGASESADAIYIQRDLFEADVVLPVYCIRTPDSPSASDKYAMSPSFADAATQHRWNLAWLEDNLHHLHLQEKLSHEAGWLMGVQFAIAVVPAWDGSIANILAGNPEPVFQKAANMLTLDRPIANETNALVIALVEGDSSQQSWMNVARAAAHAEMQLDTSGSIVICADVDHLTAGVQQLGTDEPDEKLQRRLLKSDLEDAFAAAVLSSIKSRHSIYLHCRLTAHQVENMGLAHIASSHEIEKLCGISNSICILRSAQF